MFERVICLVADGLGVGELPDAKAYGDAGANTLFNLATAVGGLDLPNLEKLGLGNICPSKGLKPTSSPLGIVSRLGEKSAGKDTTTGHWELAGVVVDKAFPLFPNGFPEDLLREFIYKAKIPGVLGNYAASGTEIIKQLGEEHCKTQKPIVYTSGDSVFQIAAHENIFGLERLYQVCEVARKVTLPYNIGRVIARPFVGETKDTFKRTEHRKDYALKPPPNLLDELYSQGVFVYSVGKIEDIFDHRGLSYQNHTGNNADSLKATLSDFKTTQAKQSFIFTNLVDFDMLYGHRRDPKGYAECLKQLDNFLPSILSQMTDRDILILTGDHGCDPTFRGTDHTREYVPLIFYSPAITGKVLKDRESFADVAATVLQAFELTPKININGKSFL